MTKSTTEDKAVAVTTPSGAYSRVADLIRRQMLDLEKSGWGADAKKAAILNLDGLAEVCDAWAEYAESKESGHAGHPIEVPVDMRFAANSQYWLQDGRRVFVVNNPKECSDWDWIIGKDVEVGGTRISVNNVEASAHTPPWRVGEYIGLVVAP